MNTVGLRYVYTYHRKSRAEMRLVISYKRKIKEITTAKMPSWHLCCSEFFDLSKEDVFFF